MLSYGRKKGKDKDMFNKSKGKVYSTDECNIAKQVTYTFRFAETKYAVKLVMDKQLTVPDEDGFVEIVTESDFYDAIVMDKATGVIDDVEMLILVGKLARRWYSMDEEDNKNLHDLLSLKCPGYNDFLDTDNISFESGGYYSNGIEDFLRRIVFLKNKRLFAVARELVENYVYLLCGYMDQLDTIEKLCITLSCETVKKQLQDNTLCLYEGGKKLKSIIGLPVDVAVKIDE